MKVVIKKVRHKKVKWKGVSSKHKNEKSLQPPQYKRFARYEPLKELGWFSDLKLKHWQVTLH